LKRFIAVLSKSDCQLLPKSAQSEKLSASSNSIFLIWPCFRLKISIAGPLRTKQKGDLLIKFVFTLPNITNETLTKALILIDKQESTNEKELTKQPNLIKTMMIDTQESDYYENKEEQEEEHTARQPECVQQ
jgi:hypothetical protein